GAICEGGPTLPYPQYGWHRSISNDSLYLECFYPSACPSNRSGQCAGGFNQSSSRCSACVDGLVLESNQCVECGGDDLALPSFLFVVAVLIFAGWLFYSSLAGTKIRKGGGRGSKLGFPDTGLIMVVHYVQLETTDHMLIRQCGEGGEACVDFSFDILGGARCGGVDVGLAASLISEDEPTRGVRAGERDVAEHARVVHQVRTYSDGGGWGGGGWGGLTSEEGMRNGRGEPLSAIVIDHPTSHPTSIPPFPARSSRQLLNAQPTIVPFELTRNHLLQQCMVPQGAVLTGIFPSCPPPSPHAVIRYNQRDLAIAGCILYAAGIPAIILLLSWQFADRRKEEQVFRRKPGFAPLRENFSAGLTRISFRHQDIERSGIWE
ncbi:hypothetical protein BDK51DRAFT_33040, partial [Blyttiomyces helicus]